MNRRATSALPLATGLLLAAGTPPAASPLLPFVALLPLAIHLRSLTPDGRGGAAAVRAGMLAGAIQHAWGLRWLPFTLAAVAGTPVGWLAFIAILGVLAAATGAAAGAAHRLLTAGRAMPAAVALPLAWVTLEWGLAHLPLGLAFPWTPLGLGLARWPSALGVAELIGIGGVTAWLACASGLLADAVARPGRRAVVVGVVALVLALAPVGWGRARAERLERIGASRPVGRITAVALDVPPSAADPAWAAAAVSASVRALNDAPPGSSDLVVLPEMILALDPTAPARSAEIERLGVAATRLRSPILVGSLEGDATRAYNSAVLIDPDGVGSFRADKRRLVPGVERANRIHAPWLAPAASGGYTAGEGWPVAVVGGLRTGVLICYEVAFGADARALVRNGANTLAALDSDAWFGGGSWARSAGIAQQLAHLTVRAIETRTAAVRSSNGGPAVLIGPSGRELARAEATGSNGPTNGLAYGILPAGEGPTPFVGTGDLAGPCATFALLVLLGAGLSRRTQFPSE